MKWHLHNPVAHTNNLMVDAAGTKSGLQTTSFGSVTCGSMKASSKARQQIGERDVASAAAVAFISIAITRFRIWKSGCWIRCRG
jgi:hypothetical protein